MTEMSCQFPDCTFKVENESEAVALAMFNSHVVSHQNPSAVRQQNSTKQKIPAIARPEIKQDATDEDWATFVQEWGHFKRCTDIPPGFEADQLFQCCERSLGRLLRRENPDIITEGEEKLLEAIQNMSVIKVATGVRRATLLATKQDHGENFREFYANIKAAAATCHFTVKCQHDCCLDKTDVDYTSQVVKDVLVAGIADSDIRKELLGSDDLDSKSDKQVVAFVEEKEIAKKAWAGSSAGATAGISGYRKGARNEEHSGGGDSSIQKKLSMKGKCAKCNVQISLYFRFRGGYLNKSAFEMCSKCFKASNQQQKPSGSASNESATSKQSDAAAVTSFIGALDVRSSLVNTFSQSAAQTSEQHVTLEHHIFSPDGWRKATSLSHPTLRLRVTTAAADSLEFNVPHPKIAAKHINVVVDSGAQSCLWSRKEFYRCGFKQSDLIPVHHAMKAANTAPITIDGAILLRLSGHSRRGGLLEAAVMTYVSPDADRFFLSREAMVQLGIITHSFPQLGAAHSLPEKFDCHALTAARLPNPVDGEGGASVADCGCLRRELPPAKPGGLPFECTTENAGKMKSWLLNRYASSSFNKCPHQVLPKMEGPPIQMHVDPNAKPVFLRKPAPVPLHWQDRVEEELYRDVALGVLERVPHGEPTKWCFRMVITRKHDGSPRRTVDLSPLNKFCEREAHSSKSPFQLARSVPSGSNKSVMDAWNGYHSVPIREEDRHLTTFNTPWGLFRYKRAPQGFLSSGDGFNRRFDDITAHVVRMERCVDDSLLHDANLEEHWWRVIEFLELVGKAGIVINPEKFQFSQPTVDFAGFRISDDSVEPLPKYIDAIKDFPKPENITDIRSWFGLVNQVSHYAQLREMMEPFRKFLSPKVKFEWTDQLDSIFEESKLRIIDAINDGVRIFDVTRRTCLRTDWSKKGIGYFLAQKHCKCESDSYGCCPDGWKITLAGSRFLSATETNYAPIEGEALAVVWSLEQTRFFTMGCTNLLVIVDHKPLTKIFGDRRLDEIDNPRLFRMKRRTLMWQFTIEYQPGKDNPFADAASRHPNRHAELASISMMSSQDCDEELFIAGIGDEVEKFFAVTWERVQAESRRDDSLRLLADQIHNGFPVTKQEMPATIREFWDFREHLTAFSDVVLYKDRIVIPMALRGRILEILHSAHQGVSGMLSRAYDTVFWPGITNAVEGARMECRPCHRNAPSQARLPPTQSKIPTVPFQMIYADYFQLMGKHFLIIGDRLSGWTEVLRVKPSTDSSGAKGLCEALRRVFVTFGVPEELSSDGGPEFIAQESVDFYERWGTYHRLSSSYFPQSNGRAEVAVKMTKRLLEDNTGPDGSLNNDKVVRALLQQRNTPDKDCQLSPAQVLFGHPLRDALPQLDKSLMVFENEDIHNQWHQAWRAKEIAIRSRLVRSCERLEEHSKELPLLREGDSVFVQNQNPASSKPGKWDREGTVVATRKNDQYLVRVEGTGRLTLRNRRFLRKFQLRSPIVTERPPRATEQNPAAIPATPRVQQNPTRCPSTVDRQEQPIRPGPGPANQTRATGLPELSPQQTVGTPFQKTVILDQIAPDHFASDHGSSVSDTLDASCQQPPIHTHADVVPPAPTVTTGTTAEDSVPVRPRRSSRTCKQRDTYDASTGKSAVPSSVPQAI